MILLNSISNLKTYPKIRLAVIGDSQTSLNEQYIRGAEDCRHWTVLVGQQLGIKVFNKGISGNSSFDLLERFSADILPLKPTHCIIEEGGNDTYQKIPPLTTMENIKKMVKICEDNKIIPIIMCSGCAFYSYEWYINNNVPNPFNWEDPQWLPTIRRLEREYCEANGYLYLDAFTPFLTSPTSSDLRYTWSDKLHMNSFGYMILASEVIKAFEPYCRRF